MVENKMNEVAKLLGVELEEEFRIEGLTRKHKLTENGLRCWFDDFQQWYASYYIDELLTGEAKIIKIPKPILTDKEKEYLSLVIKPFRKHIITIRKIQNYKYEFIEIVIYSNVEGVSCEVISFPYFNKGKMYKGIEINKEYTLKELGL